MTRGSKGNRSKTNGLNPETQRGKIEGDGLQNYIKGLTFGERFFVSFLKTVRSRLLPLIFRMKSLMPI